MTLEAPAISDDNASRLRAHLDRTETRPPGTPAGDTAPADAPREAWQSAFPLHSERQITRARHTLFRAGEELGGIPFVYSGWAARVRRLSDGRRQILSFILPGDLVSASAIFSDRLSFFVEAITDVRYSVSQRAQVDEVLARDPQLMRTLVGACLAEQADVEELATDLGRRRAEERIARLFLQLKTRLEVRGQISGPSFEMPLRQQHIADATGMTVIHVGRVLTALRGDGILHMAGGMLTITDLAALQRLSDI
jgi:CRP/FNR family transcriptional regulator, anaerobic regulatory protein